MRQSSTPQQLPPSSRDPLIHNPLQLEVTSQVGVVHSPPQVGLALCVSCDAETVVLVAHRER